MQLFPFISITIFYSITIIFNRKKKCFMRFQLIDFLFRMHEFLFMKITNGWYDIEYEMNGMEWNEMCWIVGCGSNIWSYSKPESVSPLIFASIRTYLKFTVLLFKSIDKNKTYTRFHLYFVLISSQWRSHHKLSRALRWTGMLLWRVNDFDEIFFNSLFY